MLAVDTTNGRVRTIAPGGGVVSALTWTPDGHRVVWIGPDARRDGGAVLSSARPDGSQRHTLLEGFDLRALATAPDGTLAVVRADIPDNVDCATKPPVPRAEIVLIAPDGGVRSLREVPVVTPWLLFSPDGSLLLWHGASGDPCGDVRESQVFLTDLADGRTRQVSGEAQGTGWASFSKGGSTVIVAKSDGLGQDLVRIDVASATSVRLRTPDFAESFPVFSPDGTKLAMIRTPGVPEEGRIFRPTGAPRIVIADAGGRLLQDLGPAPVEVEHLAWAPDGAYLALGGFTSVPACPGCDYGSADPGLWKIPLDGRAPSQLTTAGGFANAGLAFQPTIPTSPVIDRQARQPR
ncbi:PD40 domain-containing protein [Kineococcus xinjiangensis]|uniref:PD40 domain-containing protein n=1 Tax=Kineococcus xinjiangensis TaxID=512762 RepID=UPI001304EE5D|nr:PD40 domain-containing protein [Kineococcus xinjiangensis]